MLYAAFFRMKSFSIWILLCPLILHSTQGQDDFLWDKFPDGFKWRSATSAYQIEGAWNADDMQNKGQGQDEFLWDTFPAGFQWGTASSAYQIEGAWNIDGKGESIWDRFCHEEGRIKNNDTGDVADDSYSRYKEDIAALKNLGVHFYRFSLSWPRILPNGTLEVVNNAGIDYYNRLIDGLLAEGIQPMITLYHWDLPQALDDIGGWKSNDIVNHFNNYAKLCFRTFGDRVKLWITLNEPWVLSMLGYGFGLHAPGIRSPDVAVYQVGHNLLKAHAEAWHTYDSEFRSTQRGRISITLDSGYEEPYTNKTADVEAAERGMQFRLGWFAHPIYINGDYPQVMKDNIGRKSLTEGRSASRLLEFTDAEKARIVGTHDFFGLNHYTTTLAENYDANKHPGDATDADVKFHVDSSWPPTGHASMKEVPWGMRKLLNWIKDHYNNPEVMITENGTSDDAKHYGSLDDQQRIRFYTNYINNVLKAIRLDGCNVTAYTAWSVMNNFEWSEGYSCTFGLYRVDFSDPTRARVPKASVAFYRKLIAENGWPKLK